jgi:quercetin dioxygenase-like cupin family protein
MKNKIRRKGVAIGISLGVVLLGITAYSATTDILVEGTIPSSIFFEGPVKVTVRTLTIKPGEALPWHYHPGYAFNVVKSGTLTVEDGCGGEVTLQPGQGFEEIDSHVHRGRNNSSADVVVYDTFITREGKPTTVTLPERRCGPPTDVDECKDDGWRKFTHPQNFTSTEQCVSFVRDRRRNPKPF